MSFQNAQNVFPEWEGFFEPGEEEAETYHEEDGNEAHEDSLPAHKKRVSYAALVEDYLTGEGISMDGLAQRVAGAAITQYWLESVFPPEVAAAHKSCSLHFHELASLGMGKYNAVTLNLPQLGYLAADEDDFFKRLDSLLVLAKEGLDVRRQAVAKLKLKLHEEGLFETGQSASKLVLCGMAECCGNLLGAPSESERGKAFSEKLHAHLARQLDSYSEQDGLPFLLEDKALPEIAERFAAHDSAAYPDKDGTNDGEHHGYSGDTAPAVIPAMHYELFSSPRCPHCPPLESFMAASSLEGKQFNVDTKKGLKLATERGVFITPTLIFYNDEEKEIARAHNVDEVQALGILGNGGT